MADGHHTGKCNFGTADNVTVPCCEEIRPFFTFAVQNNNVWPATDSSGPVQWQSQWAAVLHCLYLKKMTISRSSCFLPIHWPQRQVTISISSCKQRQTALLLAVHSITPFHIQHPSHIDRLQTLQGCESGWIMLACTVVCWRQMTQWQQEQATNSLTGVVLWFVLCL